MRTTETIGGLQRGAIGAHVLDAAVGIARDAQRRRQIRRGVEARRRDRHRQRGKSLPGALSSSPVMTTSWQGGDVDRDRRDRIGDRLPSRLRRSPRPGCPMPMA